MRPLVSKNRVLITGANGFIGSHLVQRLVKDESLEVAVLIRSKKNFLVKELNINILMADLLDFSTLKRAVNEFQPQIVYHLAGVRTLGRSWEDIRKAYQTNLMGTMNLLHSLEGLDVKAIVLLGSAAEYGKGPAPFKEGQVLQPASAYGASKAAATSLGILCHQYFDLPIVIFRPTVVYGPGQGENFFFSQLCRSILSQRPFYMSPGEQYRDFIYISDVIESLSLVLCNPNAIGEVFNIGSGVSYPLRYIAKIACKYLGEKNLLQIGAKPYIPEEQFAYVVDIHLAQQVLKWQPKVSLEQGIASTIEWYKYSKKDWQKTDGSKIGEVN